MRQGLKNLIYISTLIALSGIVVGCGGDDDEITPAPDAGMMDGDVVADGARLRAIHLANDVPAVSIFANDGDTPAVPELSFPAGTPYLDLDAGDYNIDVSVMGMTAADAALTADLTLEDGKSYTAVALGTLSDADTADLALLALEDDYSDLAADSIRIRAIHAAPGVGEVDIWNVTDPAAPAPLYEDVPFGAAGAYLDLPVAAYTIGFDTNNDAVPELTFDVPALPAGTVANVFATNDADANVFLVAQINDGSTVRLDPATPGKAAVRAIHLSPDAPSVDVFVNGGAMAAVTALAFEAGTPFISDLAPAVYNLAVGATGNAVGDAVFNKDFPLLGGASYTVAAIGTLANDATDFDLLALVDDLSAPADGKIRVRAIHAAPAVGEVDIWNITDANNPAPLYENVPFGGVGAYIELDAMTAYSLGIDVDNDQMPDVQFDIPPVLPGGTIANLFASNDDGGVVSLIGQTQGGMVVKLSATP